MSLIAFPLRLEGSTRQPDAEGLVHRGGLLRCERVEAINRLIEIMANTPAGSWAADERFGFPFFMGSPSSEQAASHAVLRSLNAALEELGITDFRFESLVRAPLQKSGEVCYRAALRSTGSGKVHSVEVPRQECDADQSTNNRSDR